VLERWFLRCNRNSITVIGNSKQVSA
jgi:hypothetical protein